jgi:hypothetical protein
VDAADELLHTKLTRRPTPRKTTYLGPPPHHPSVASRRGRVPMPTRPAPAVPPATAANENYRGRRRGSGQQHRHDYDDDDVDQASRIWAKIRRCSGLSLADRTNMSLVGEDQSLAAKRGIPSKAGVKGRKGSGRWGFGNWWA